MYVCICMYMYIQCTYIVYVCTLHICIYLCIYVCTCMYVSMYIYSMYVDMYVCMYVSLSSSRPGNLENLLDSQEELNKTRTPVYEYTLVNKHMPPSGLYIVYDLYSLN